MDRRFNVLESSAVRGVMRVAAVQLNGVRYTVWNYPS